MVTGSVVLFSTFCAYCQLHKLKELCENQSDSFGCDMPPLSPYGSYTKNLNWAKSRIAELPMELQSSARKAIWFDRLRAASLAIQFVCILLSFLYANFV